MVYETVVIDLDPDFMRTVVSKYIPGGDEVLALTVPDNEQRPVTQTIPYFVIAGMLERSAQYPTQ